VSVADGNHVIVAPKDFYLLGFQKTVDTVEFGKVQDDEVIIVVNVDLGTLIEFTPAVFDVEGMEIIIVFQKLKILFFGLDNMVPFNGSYFNGINHDSLPSFMMLNADATFFDANATFLELF
jgi:hypothetical protein